MIPHTDPFLSVKFPFVFQGSQNFIEQFLAYLNHFIDPASGADMKPLILAFLFMGIFHRIRERNSARKVESSRNAPFVTEVFMVPSVLIPRITIQR